MSPQDQNYGAGADAAHAADTIQKQMSIEEEAAKPQEAPVDNSILAGIEDDEDVKSLSDVIHAGATPSADPTPTDFASEPAKPEKVKKPVNKKPIIFGIIGVIVLAGVGVGIWALISALGNTPDNGGAKADPDRMAFFVEDKESTSVAVYNDKGDKKSDFIYEKVSDFNDAGYAAVKKPNSDEYGVVSNTGMMSVGYGVYASVEKFGQYFIAENDEGKILIDGTGAKILDIENTEDTNGLFSVYDGSKSVVYDKEGNKVIEVNQKRPLNESPVDNNLICFYNDGKMNCYDTRNGNKVHSIESATPLALPGYASVSPNFKCIRFENAEPDKKEAIFYSAGKLTNLGSKYTNGGMIAKLRDRSDNCFFTNGDTIVMGSDYVEVTADPVFSTAQVVIRDSKHYAYLNTSESTSKYIMVHIGDKEVKLPHTASYYPSISGGDDYIVTLNNNTLAIYKDSIEPAFQMEVDNGTFWSAEETSDIDENGNIASNRFLVDTKKKKVIYKSEQFGIHMTYYDGLYYLRNTYKDEGEYIAVINKDGKAVVAEGQYDSVRHSDYGNYLIAKKGTNAFLLDKEGKVLLEDFDGFDVYKSHIVAIKDGNYVYFTHDLKRLN